MRIARAFAVAAGLFAAGCNNTEISSSANSISVTPLALDFGNETASSQTSKTITVSNDGLTTLTISSVAITNDARSAFSLGATPQQLSAGSNATIQVTYTAPAAEGADGASLTILSDASNTPDLTVSLSGRSVLACVPETDTAFCTRLGTDCGTVTAADNCGAERTVTSCGTCTSPQICDGLGVNNVCDAPVFPVTVTLAGGGSGSVISSPAGINCDPSGASCSASFGSGSTVTLTAIVGPSSTFSGFSGNCSGLACSLTIGAAANVVATFAPTHSISVTVSGNGSVASSPTGIDSCGEVGGVCSAAFTDGVPVVLTAMPSSGNLFTGWSGGGCSGTSTCTITLSGGAAATTATFLPNMTLTLTGAGAGSGTITTTGLATNLSCSWNGSTTSGTCTAQVPAETAVTVSASASSGSTFSAFSGGTCSGTTCSFTIAGAIGVTATFQQAQTLTLTGAGTGTGTITTTGLSTNLSCGWNGSATSGTCTAQVPYGTLVTVEAAGTGFGTFTAFSGGTCTGTSCSFNITGTAGVTATFRAATYSIGGTVVGLSGSGLVLANSFNGGTAEQHSISSNGMFVFGSGANAGDSYSVSVFTNPSSPAQSCSVATGTGSGTANANVTSVEIDCPPAVVTSGLDGPYSVSVNGPTVYFAVNFYPTVADCYTAQPGAGDRLMMAPASGGAATMIDYLDNYAGNCGLQGLSFDSSYVYWANYSDGTLKRATLAGASPTTIYTAGEYLNAVAIDPVGGFLYLHNYPNESFQRITTSGTGLTSFATSESTNGQNFAAGNSTLYWADSVVGTVNYVPFNASPLPASPTQIATSETSPSAPFVTSSIIYWVSSDALRYSPLASPFAASLATGLATPTSLVVDSNYAYVLASGSSATDGRIYKISLLGGEAPVIIAHGLYQPNSLAMDASHLYWANSNTTTGGTRNSDGTIMQIVK